MRQVCQHLDHKSSAYQPQIVNSAAGKRSNLTHAQIVGENTRCKKN